ncbi:MAG: low affinity iron permease family protein [Rhizobiaceae bacterium]|nr:MAG: low affinity iron permease family protein [Rhizobiaceae bacterium]
MSSRFFTKIANRVASAAGHPATFIGCVAIVVVWAASGPLFHFSDTWQLIINTGTTIVTFLMVFLIQNTQNRDGAAIQAKLDELIRAGRAENVFIGIEHLTEEEVNEFRERCEKAAIEHGLRKSIYGDRAEPSGKVIEVKQVAKRTAARKVAAGKKPARKGQPEKLK